MTEAANIMIVDDSPANVDQLVAILRSAGYHIRAATSGALALQAAELYPPDLVLLDILMPEMDGFEVCRQLQQKPKTREVPVIFLSALQETEDKLRAFDAGGVDYITKPFHAQEVLARVKTQLYLRRALLQLADARDGLEQRVRQRTAELETEIAARERVEQELRQAKNAAEAASRAKSAFLSRMSHELRTPLNGILGYAQLLQQTDILSPKQHSQVAAIYRSGAYLLTLINDILDLAKIEAGKLELHPGELYPQTFFSDIAALFEMRAHQQGIAFEYQAPDAEAIQPSAIEADEKSLRQVLLNLLSNAVKFTDHGKVILRVKYRGDALLIAVEDSGRGIAAEDFERIFEPFRQVGDQKFHEGSGLGLPISRKLVHMMGGELKVESTLGAGSRFYFQIPIKVIARDKRPASNANPAHVSGFVGASHKILVVDDEIASRNVLVDLLGALSFTLAQAENGLEALRQAEQFKPDVIIMDIKMPKLDGIETVRRLRQDPRFQAIPIFALSAAVFAEQQAEALAAGYTVFLEKPLHAPSLLKALETYGGIHWQYEQPPKPKISPPPLGVMQELARLCEGGDIDALEKRLQELQQDAGLRPFCDQALEYTNQFQLHAFKNFLRGFDTNEENQRPAIE